MDQENVGQPKGENGECSTRFTSPETTLTSAVVAAAIRNVYHSTHLSRLLRVLPPSLRSKPQIFLALSERSTNPDAILRALRELREAGESPPPDSIPRILNKLPPNLWREAVEVVRTVLRRSEANAPSSSSIPSTLPSNCFFPNTPLSLECFVVLLRLAARAGALSFVENLGKDLSFVNGTASLSRSEPEAIQFPEAFFSDATRSSIRTSLCVAKFTQKGLAPERSPTRLNVRRMEKHREMREKVNAVLSRNKTTESSASQSTENMNSRTDTTFSSLPKKEENTNEFTASDVESEFETELARAQENASQTVEQRYDAERREAQRIHPAVSELQQMDREHIPLDPSGPHQIIQALREQGDWPTGLYLVETRAEFRNSRQAIQGVIQSMAREHQATALIDFTEILQREEAGGEKEAINEEENAGRGGKLEKQDKSKGNAPPPLRRSLALVCSMLHAHLMCSNLHAAYDIYFEYIRPLLCASNQVQPEIRGCSATEEEAVMNSNSPQQIFPSNWMCFGLSLAATILMKQHTQALDIAHHIARVALPAVIEEAKKANEQINTEKGKREGPDTESSPNKNENPPISSSKQNVTPSTTLPEEENLDSIDGTTIGNQYLPGEAAEEEDSSSLSSPSLSPGSYPKKDVTTSALLERCGLPDVLLFPGSEENALRDSSSPSRASALSPERFLHNLCATFARHVHRDWMKALRELESVFREAGLRIPDSARATFLQISASFSNESYHQKNILDRFLQEETEGREKR